MTRSDKGSDLIPEPIFDDGPFPHFQKSIGLFRPVGVRVTDRVVFVVILGWLVLAILVIVDGFDRSGVVKSFFFDVAVHARSLIAAPLFIVAESLSLPRLEKIARNFISAGIVTEKDHGRFLQAVASTRRLINSSIAEGVAIFLAYSVAFPVIRYAPQSSLLAAWYTPHHLGYSPFSLAGWWQVLVSLPLLLILFFGWLWRAILWGRFLVKLSLLDLELIAAHPDGAAGLKFIANTMFAFMPVAFSLGVIVSGALANRVINVNLTLSGFRQPLFGLVIFVLFLFVSPLLVFCKTLFTARRLGIMRYGALANRVGHQFELKWLDQEETINASALEAPDFSSTTDLYQIVSNVHQITGVPFDLRSLIGLVAITLLPVVPVALLTVPLSVVVTEVLKILL